MKDRIVIFGLMGVIAGELEQLVKVAGETGDHKLADEMAQFRDEFKVRLEQETKTVEDHLNTVKRTLGDALFIQEMLRKGNPAATTKEAIDAFGERLAKGLASFSALT